MPPADDLDEIVCFCFSVTRHEVLQVIQREDVRTVPDITNHCKAGNGCTSCWPMLQEILMLKPPDTL